MPSYDQWGNPIGGSTTAPSGYDQWGNPIHGSASPRPKKPPKPKQSHDSSLWWDALSNNPVSEAVGHAGDYVGRSSVGHDIGHAQDFASRVGHTNPVTGEALRLVAGPHQLVDFATHDWIAGLWALGHLAGHDVTTPSVWLEDPRRYLRDPHTLGGGFLSPLVKSYNTKYQILPFWEDVLTGHQDRALHDLGKVTHNVEQDPFGTLLDVSVAGKALGATHLASLERASAAGKLAEGGAKARIASRVLDENPREYRVFPERDTLGKDYVGAKGTLVTKTHRAPTTQGRLLQSYMDEMRLRLPANMPFSAHRLSSKEMIRQVNQVFQRNGYHIKAAMQLVNQLPEGLRYAMQHVAELPRDVATVGGDPIGHMLDFYKQERDKLVEQENRQAVARTTRTMFGKKKESSRLGDLGSARLRAVEHRIAVLQRVDEVKQAIYDPAHADHQRFMEAYKAVEHADQIVRRELVRRNLVKGDMLEAQDMLPHRLLRGVRYNTGLARKDILGSYEGPIGPDEMLGQTTEQALQQEGDALASFERGGAQPVESAPVVHHYDTGGHHPSTRIAVLIDKRTGEVHIGTGMEHGELGDILDTPKGPMTGEEIRARVDAPMEDWGQYYQLEIKPANPEYDIPRHWTMPRDVPPGEADAMVAKLQSIENMPVDPGTGKLIPARPTDHGAPTVHRHPLPPDATHPERRAVLIDERTGEIHMAEPTGAPARHPAPAAAWHADLAQEAGIPAIKGHYIQAALMDAVPAYDVPRRWVLPSEVPADKIDQIVHDLQRIENLPVEKGGGFEPTIPPRAEDAALHNPLAQYGPAFHWPHEASFAVTGAPESLTTNLFRRIVSESDSERLSKYGQGFERQRPGDTWLEGLINSHPETLTQSHFYRWAQVRAKDFVDDYLYPMSGRLEAGKGYEAGGKLGNESYILKPKHLTQEPLVTSKTHFRTLSDLTHDFPSLRRITEGENKETMDMWINRLDEHGLRRVKTKYIDRWEKETNTSRSLFQKVFHGGLNQVWRYLLLGIKPSWAIANYYTNQALVFLKNAGRGGIRAFLYAAKDANKRNIYKLLQYTKRMNIGHEARLEVNRLLNEHMGRSIHEEINRTEPVIHASTFGHTRFFEAPKAGRKVPTDALTPQGKFFRRLANHPGYTSRRALHVLDAPRRFVEKLNQGGEEFTRDQAYLAKLYQMTGKMASSGEGLRQILRDAKIRGNKEKMQELLMGPNGPMDALGDYSRMTAAERERIVAVMPFYPWYKTIMGITAKFFVHDVERIWVLHALAQGLAQVAEQDMQLGVPVPSFASDLIPVFGPEGDHQLTMATRTWNPFQTPVDIGRNIEAFATADPAKATPNEVGLGLFGPTIQAGYTAATGQDPFYGGAYSGWGSGQGRPGAVIGSFFYGLPQNRLADQLRGQYKSKVFEAPNKRDQQIVGILQYLGIPVKYVNLPNLETRAIEEGAQPFPSHSSRRKARRRPVHTGGGGYDQWGNPIP